MSAAHTGESRLLARAVAAFASATFLSRLVGFVRDMVIAMFFGAGHRADAFFIAFSIPSLLRRLFAEGALSASFVAVLSKSVQKDGDEAGNDLFQKVLTLLSIVLAGVTLFGVIAAPILVWIMAPGFSQVEGKHEMTVLLTRIMFPFLFFIGLATTVMAVLNTKGRFFIASFTSFVFNLAIIASAIIGYYSFDQSIYALGIGVTIGGLLQFLMQLPLLYRLRYQMRFRLDFRDPRIVQIMTLMGPGVLGLAVAQVNTTVDSIIASYLAVGSVSFLYYANRLVQFPLGVFGVAVSTAILPGLSRSATSEDKSELNFLLQRGIHLVNFVMLPCIVGLAVAGDDIIRMLFLRGEFGEYDAYMTYLALAAYALGLLAFALVKLVVSLFYALEDSKTPLKAAMWAMGINVALNLALMYPLGHAGLALATSFASWGNFLYLWYIAHQRGLTSVKLIDRQNGLILLASIFLLAFLLGVKYGVVPVLGFSSGWRVLIYLSLSAIVYFGITRFMGINALHHLKKSFSNKEI